MSQEQQKALLEKRNKDVADARAIVDAAIEAERALSAEGRSRSASSTRDYATWNTLEDVPSATSVIPRSGRSSPTTPAGARRSGAARPEDRRRGAEVRALAKVRSGRSTSSTATCSRRRPAPRCRRRSTGRSWSPARYTGPMLDVAFILSTSGGESIQIPRTNAYSTGSVTAGRPGSTGRSDVPGVPDPGGVQRSTFFQVSGDPGGQRCGPAGLHRDERRSGGRVCRQRAPDDRHRHHAADGHHVVGRLGRHLGTTGTFSYTDVVDPDVLDRRGGSPDAGFGSWARPAPSRRCAKVQDATAPTSGSRRSSSTSLTGCWAADHGEPAHGGSGDLVFQVARRGRSESFIVRQVGGIRLDRSDDYAFGNSLVTFRATWRGDSGLRSRRTWKYLLTK